jgi:hypothetical protein
MKNLILAVMMLSFGDLALANDGHCIEKTSVRTVEFYYASLLKVTTSGQEYILMTDGCGDLSAAASFELKSTSGEGLSICKLDTVVLLNSEQKSYGACLISEILKEE